jgi:uncharacterized membrane protein
MLPGSQKQRRRILSVPTALLWLLIIAYVIFFSAYTSQKHLALRTYAADLSYFDQPMWNTLHGRFMERTLQDRQAPRMTDHFEPILVPLSALYWIWDDVRVLLVLQAVALALGALPVYWIAGAALSSVWGSGAQAPDRAYAPAVEWLALVFAIVYLLFPAQQAANLADFHADPLLVAPLLFAFWFAIRRRYGWMWVSAILALAVKENLPTITFMLGLFLVLSDEELRSRLRRASRDVPGARDGEASRPQQVLRKPWVQGAVLMGVSLVWLYVAMFRIVGPAARQFYGTEGPVYLASRFGETGGGAISQLRDVIGRAAEGPRLAYLAVLFASVGWLALLAPGYLLLGLPVLVANFLSLYPGQYSGEQHYSAPLVPAFTIAAIYGTQRLGGWVARLLPEGEKGRRSRTVMAAGFGAWLLGWALVCQMQYGWTPLGRNFSWPQVTEHARLLERFTVQIPPDAVVSTTPPLSPHLSHRRVLYQFPTIKPRAVDETGSESLDADYVVVDVSGVTDMHPNDVRIAVESMLASGRYGVVDAADGYLLLSREAAKQGQSQVAPDAFYDFARAGDRRPQHPLNVRFGDSLQLLGYDIEDDPKWRQTRYRFYWQALAPLPEDTAISVQMLTPWGAVADDTALRPMPALLWYPPPRWKPGEVVITETVPWYLPRSWAPSIEISAGGQKLRPVAPEGSDEVTPDAQEGRLLLQPRERRGREVVPLERAVDKVKSADARFGETDWAVRLTGYAAPERVAPGHDLAVTLRWEAEESSPAQTDYTVFLHLRDESGRTLANADATPTWFASLPTSQWPVEGKGILDAHALSLPAGLPPGDYSLVVGWYDWRTGQRLPMLDAAGNALGEEYVLGSVTIRSGAAPVPDLCCLYARECCASRE